MRGTVKWYSEEKGYGFITPQEGTKDVFVHNTALRSARISNLQEGQQVEFDTQSGPKGLQACDVSLA